MGNFCSCCEELLVEDELPPIVFFDLEDLKNLGTTPRSPEDKHLHRKYDDIDKDNSVFIFISHCWKRGYKGAPGYDGRPHPVYVYVCICICICMYECMYTLSVCMFVCMFVCMYACMYACMYV